MSVKSYWYTNYYKQIFDNSPAYGGWKASGGDTFRVMLITSAYVPNQDNQAVKNDLTGEVAGQGYNAGGQVLASKTISVTNNVLVMTAADVTWSNCIFSTRYAVIYDDTNASPLSKQLVRWIDFGQNLALNNQSLTLKFDGLGNVDVIPGPIPPQTTPPQLTAASINTSTLVLTYVDNESLDTASTPATSAYIVKVNGVAQAAPSAVVVAATTVTLTTVTPVTGAQVVTLDYTAPAINPIQDLSGNDAASFQNLSVQNNTVTPLVDGATFVSQSVPSTMTTATGYPVTVTLNNSGTTSWVSPNYVLRSTNPDGNNTWGLVAVQLAQIVLPGSNATFSFTVSAPSSAGTYNFQWRMYNGTANFGVASTNVSVTVSTPVPPPTPTLTVQAPNGSENWVLGSSQTIRWATSNVTNPSTVRIELSINSGSTWTTLFTGISNTGAQAWTVAGTANTTSKIRVTSESAPSATDTSDAVFTIANLPPPPATISVVYPNGGENVLEGSVQTLRWSSANLGSDTIKVELTRDAGSTYETLFPSLTNDGSENWVVSQPVGVQNKLRVSGVLNPTIIDSSDSVWTISAVLSGTTRWVSLTGNDVTGTGTQINPWRTIRKGLTTCVAGDRLYVRAGTFIEAISSYTYVIPSGTSFSNAITVQAYDGSNTTILKPSGGEFCLRLDHANRYLIFDGLIFDAINTTGDTVKVASGDNTQAQAAHHIRIQNGTIRNSGTGLSDNGNPQTQGVFTGQWSNGCEFLRNTVQDNGASLLYDHNFYIAGTGVLIDGNTIFGAPEFGVQLQGVGMQSGNIVRNNRIFQNGSGVYAAAQSGAQIYNNLVYSNAGGSPFTRRGIFVRYSSTGTLVYYNTIYANQSYGISNGDGEGNSPANSNIRDNILNGNGGTIEDTGTGTVNTNNLTTGLASNIWVNPGTIQTSDFHLKAGSPAINFGIAISGFPTDLDGVVRGNPPDAGAYEFV